MDRALQLAQLVIRLLAFEERCLTGMELGEYERMMDCKEQLHNLAADTLEREERWQLTPLKLFDSNDN